MNSEQPFHYHALCGASKKKYDKKDAGNDQTNDGSGLFISIQLAYIVAHNMR